jgi:patatin-like phospholipase/acyl hydrolase
MDSKFKILSIDGGGIKGLYSLYVLDQIEKKHCKKNETIGDYFDLICGTSTGGIIALGIANKIKIEKLIEIYENNASKIFPKNNFIFNNFMSPFFGIDKYDNDTIKNIADKYFQDKKLCDLNNLVCIPSYNNSTGYNIVFKYPHKEGNLFRDKNILLKDVIMSTVSAPYYFQSHKINIKEINGNFLDGGLWANNPSLVGIDESLQFFVGKDKKYKSYDLLSVGNVNYVKNNNITTNSWNILNFSYLIELIFSSNSKSIDKYCRTISKFADSEYTRIECTDINVNYCNEISLDNSNKHILEYYKQKGIEDGIKYISDNNKEYKYIERFFLKKKSYIIEK